MGQAAIESIIDARQDKPFTDLFDFCEKVDLRKVNRRVIEALIKCGAFDSTGVSRSVMSAAVDDALERGGRIQKERDQGQASLFAVMAETEEPAPIRWPKVPEWRESLRLAYEKESLGFYISGHPLAKYENELACLTNTNSERIKDMPDKTQVRLGGVVAKVQLKMTKKMDRMAFVTLEDLAGMVEILVFPDLFQTCESYLEQDKPILVVGDLTVDEKGGSATNKIKAKEIMPLEAAMEKMAKSVVFNCSTTGTQSRDLMKLKSIVESHRGQVQAVLKMKVAGQGTVVLKLNRGVKPSPNLIREAKDILGDGGVMLHYSNGNGV